MFKFEDLKEIHLEITNNCQASCPMCSRNRNSGLENPLLKLTDWSLDEFKTIMTKTVLKQIEGFFFCGNFGDPIINKDLIEMCRYSVNINSNLRIIIHTNGSARTPSWWKELANVLPKNHRVVFALDGLKGTHELYRIGTNFETVIKNAKAFIESGGIAEWCFIKFKHNEHQINDAKKMAENLRFDRFSIKNSSRFLLEPKVNVLDKHSNITHIIEPSTDTSLKYIDENAIKSYKSIVENSVIDCRSLKNREIYIDCYRNVFPCVWIGILPYTYIEENAAAPVRFEILNQYNNLILALGNITSLYSLTNTLEDIINSSSYQNVWKTFWEKKKLITCARTCGNNDYHKTHDQQIELIHYE